MKAIISSFIISLMFFSVTIGQDVTTVEAKSTDISENLDLEAVASIFGESENLEDFEYKLNDPELKISNLDLNGDGYVDYLRVLENSESKTILITIQAVLGKDIYQDVATIDVEKDNQGKTHVQVVGDVYMYGPDYIIEPVYIYSPPVVLYFWGPNYRPWYSPYYWHYYPDYYYSWHPYSCQVYHNNVHVHVNVNHRYYYTDYRRSTTASHMHSRIGRNDYARSYPERAFSSRNTSIKNSHELRGRTNTQTSSSRYVSTGRTSNTRDLNEGRSSGNGSVSGRSSGTRTPSYKNSTSSSQTRNQQVGRSNTSRGSSSGRVQGSTSRERSSQVNGSQGKQSNSRQTRSGQSQVKQSSSKQTVETGRSGSRGSSGQRSGNGNSKSSNGKERGKR